MKSRWYKGHIGRFWEDDFKLLPYVQQPLMDEEIAAWVEKGYDHVKSFSGSMYDNRNPMPSWTENFRGIFHMCKDLTFTFYKMKTLEIMPEHVDHFNTYCKINDVPKKRVIRILVMLENWQPGHCLEIDGIGITNWIAGDYFVWENDVPHSAANIGVSPRYTLQITATKIPSQDIWHKLHWFNIPDLLEKPESDGLLLLHSDLNSKTTPFFVYTYNSKIDELDTIEHDEDTINYLNKEGLDIYLYEPLCSYALNQTYDKTSKFKKHNLHFYSEFDGTENVSILRAEELDSILFYVIKNRLTNVTIRSCDYDIEKYYPYYANFNNIKLVCDDLFIKTCRKVQVSNTSVNPYFSKKFMSANWRYAPHRHLIAAYLVKLDSYISWYYRSDFFFFALKKWLNIFEWENNELTKNYHQKMLVGVQYLNENAPFNLDLELNQSISLKPNTLIPLPNSTIEDNMSKEGLDKNNALEKFYNDIFCDVVTESRFAQPTGNYSEKVYFPMWYKKSFILVAPPNTLKYLQEQGFKTFNDFWDESYDSEANHEQRLIKILQVIDFINEKSMDELRDMYVKMLPILLHNYNLVSKILYRD